MFFPSPFSGVIRECECMRTTQQYKEHHQVMLAQSKR